MTPPGFRREHWLSVFSPIQSSENKTFVLSNFSNSGTSFESDRSFVLPFGRPKCDASIQEPPLDKIYLIVGSAATIQELSDIRPASSKGTLKSTLTKAFFSEKSI